MGLDYLGIPFEVKQYELRGFNWQWGDKLLSTAQLGLEFSGAQEKDHWFDHLQVSNSLYKRLIKWSRTYFKKDASAAVIDINRTTNHRLPLGRIERLGLPFESYEATFNENIFSTAPEEFKNKLTSNFYKSAGLTLLDSESNYRWIPSGQFAYSKNLYYQSSEFADAVGNRTIWSFDELKIMIAEEEDAMNNVIKAKNDYYHLQVSMATDPNGNRAGVIFSPLGYVMASARMGKINGP